ncbi:MAG: DUF1232 domain-containing protein [Devosiaceae bacterium]|nr:DUF1232 domain-containing protein [Devosiaceae bacterium]
MKTIALEPNNFYPYIYLMTSILTRLLMLRRHLIALWRAFWHPATPFYLKTIMLAVVIYLFSPIDIIPDFLIGLGWIDDVLLVSLASNWIIKRLPPEVLGQPTEQYSQNQYTKNEDFAEEENGPVIDGTSRRL